MKTLSPALINSGYSTGIIDSDIVFDEQGFPYIPARRLKGLLRESALEVAEIVGIDKSIVDSLFGVSGFKSSKIKIENFTLENYELFVRDITSLKAKEEIIAFANSQRLKNHFTVIRAQTAIDINTGVAKNRSLRLLRYLRSGLTFVGQVQDIEKLTEEEKGLLILAFYNLRRLGTGRNKGFGMVKFISDETFSVKEIIDKLKKSNGKGYEKVLHNNTVNDDSIVTKTDKGEMVVLDYQIELLEPVIISKFTGDTNTVSTERFIHSSHIIGALANEYIKKSSFESDLIHEDEFFYEAFLSGNTYYSYAFPMTIDNGMWKKYTVAPFFLQSDKTRDESTIINLFAKECIEGKYKPLSCFIDEKFLKDEDSEIESYDVSVIQYFHNRRERITGRSNEESGDIFYYEAIAPNQCFHGRIIGNKNIIEKLISKLGTNLELVIGKSKAAQYGKVRFSFLTQNLKSFEDYFSDEIENIYDHSEDNLWILWCETPLVLLNKFGYPQPEKSILEEYLKQVYNLDVKVLNIIAKFEYIEKYQGTWKFTTPTIIAYSPGSSFLISASSQGGQSLEKLKELLQKGLGEYKEFGFGRIKVVPLEILNTDRTCTGDSKIGNPNYGNLDNLSHETKTLLKELLIEYIEEFTMRKAIYYAYLEEPSKLKKKGVSKHFISVAERNIVAVIDNLIKENREYNNASELEKAFYETIGNKLLANKLLEYDIVSDIFKYYNESLKHPKSMLNRVSRILDIEPETFEKEYLLKNLKNFSMYFLRTLRMLLKKEVNNHE